MTQWIDGNYDVGYMGFLVERSNPIRHTETYILQERPVYTNQSHEPRLFGWGGAWNDTNTYGAGIARVVRCAKNGRCQITQVSNRTDIVTFLETVGFPTLIEQWDKYYHKD